MPGTCLMPLLIAQDTTANDTILSAVIILLPGPDDKDR